MSTNTFKLLSIRLDMAVDTYTDMRNSYTLTSKLIDKLDSLWPAILDARGLEEMVKDAADTDGDSSLYYAELLRDFRAELHIIEEAIQEMKYGE